MKQLRTINDINAEAVRRRGRAWVEGVLAGLNGAGEMYNGSISHPYDLCDCVLLKMNLITKAKVRRNPRCNLPFNELVLRDLLKRWQRARRSGPVRTVNRLAARIQETLFFYVRHYAIWEASIIRDEAARDRAVDGLIFAARRNMFNMLNGWDRVPVGMLEEHFRGALRSLFSAEKLEKYFRDVLLSRSARPAVPAAKKKRTRRNRK